MCSSRQCASNDMRHDPLHDPWVTTWPWPEVKFQVGLSRSKRTSFDAAWREKHDGATLMSVSLLYEKFLAKNWGGHKRSLFWPPQFFPNNFSYNRDTDMGVAPSCFSRQAASNDVLFDLFDLERPTWNLTSGQGHVVTQGSWRGSCRMSFEAHWRDEHIGDFGFAISSFYRELLSKEASV